ncbi:MAG: hypothetical protein ACI4UK_02275 [Floccifex sp.]
MNNPNIDEVIEELKQDSMNDLDVLSEVDNKQNEEIVNEARHQIQEVFDEFQEEEEQLDDEQMQDRLNKIKEDILNILQATKEKVILISKNEDFIQLIESSKDFLFHSTQLLKTGCKQVFESDAVSKIRNNESVQEFVKKAEDLTDTVRRSDTLKQVIDSAEDVTKKMNTAIFKGLKKIIKDKEDME